MKQGREPANSQPAADRGETPMTDTLSRDEPADLIICDSPDTVPQGDDPGQSWSCGPLGYWPV